MKQHWVILSVTLMATFTIFQAGCSGSQPSAEAPFAPPSKPDVNLVQLSPAAIRSSQLETVTVEARTVSLPIQTTGEIKPNENARFHVSSFVSGRVVQDRVVLGSIVRQEQTLAVVQNLEVAKVQANFIHELHQNEIEVRQAKTRFDLATQNLEREQRLFSAGISPRKDYQQAQTELTLARAQLEGQQEHTVHIQAEAKALLSAYGLKPDPLHTERIPTDSPIVAPRAGLITNKTITVGDMVTPDRVMYEITDLSTAWLEITIYPSDLNQVKIGQPVRFTSDSFPGKVFSGTINYLQATPAETTPTFLARAYLDNASGLLRPGMFGQVTLQRPLRQTKPFLPEAAVQTYGKETFVFRAIGQGRFRKQLVSLGEKVPGGYLVNQGVQAGESIVGQGSFTLKAELLKTQFAEEE